MDNKDLVKKEVKTAEKEEQNISVISACDRSLQSQKNTIFEAHKKTKVMLQHRSAWTATKESVYTILSDLSNERLQERICLPLFQSGNVEKVKAVRNSLTVQKISFLIQRDRYFKN